MYKTKQINENKFGEDICVDNTILLGDMRTQAVKRGDFRKMYKGSMYYMSTFVGRVIELQVMYNNPHRARIVIELQARKATCIFCRN